ncbi:NAD-dependent epimerase/dehydratase family protein [Rubellimicrobium rubrum]|uniref:NAD-dependent epimerase/dehydratase family protein n=1 Tax=Rubellimicrobium rubrum TaxID=2585369 RepID=A0A5C4MN44_9RHOB|nr:NAD-dependent epimerase/dehydratase family protein [Rubellimicrobium rubrum]TNC47000.1 NAD-dependent epimerase/dehydratase family protein [Rubellimicrobium rubrum]
MTHWLVTGGAGFIGSHLVRRLVAQGDAVTVLDDLSTGFAENLSPAAGLVVGDILDAPLVERCMAGVQGVFHLAANVSVQDCVHNLLAAHRVNLTGTLTILEAARRSGNCPVVFASSAAVYGDQGDRPCSEDMAPAPISPYGADKAACEMHARALHGIHGLPTAALRFFNVYGPGQDSGSPYAGVISRFLDNLRQGCVHRVFGDGGQTRDFVCVDDVVAALIAAQDLLAREPQALVANVCTGRSISLLELAAALDRLGSGRATPIEHAPVRAGDIRHSRGAPDRMERDLGLRASIPLDRGLARLLTTDPHPAITRSVAGTAFGTNVSE